MKIELIKADALVKAIKVEIRKPVSNPKEMRMDYFSVNLSKPFKI